MKARRCNFEPPEARLSFLMLAYWSPALSLLLMFYALSVIFAPSGEARLNMKLLPKDSGALASARDQHAEILIQGDWLIKFDGAACDVAGARKLPELQARIRAHKQRPDAAAVVIYVEGDVVFQRLLDVLNAFELCGNPKYRIVIGPSFVGPRVPVDKPSEPQEPEEPVWIWLMRRHWSGL